MNVSRNISFDRKMGFMLIIRSRTLPMVMAMTKGPGFPVGKRLAPRIFLLNLSRLSWLTTWEAAWIQMDSEF